MMLKCLITSKRVGFLRGGNAINSNGLNDCWRPAVDFHKLMLISAVTMILMVMMMILMTMMIYEEGDKSNQAR